jgi:hypothetical protein
MTRSDICYLSRGHAKTTHYFLVHFTVGYLTPVIGFSTSGIGLEKVTKVAVFQNMCVMWSFPVTFENGWENFDLPPPQTSSGSKCFGIGRTRVAAEVEISLQCKWEREMVRDIHNFVNFFSLQIVRQEVWGYEPSAD